MSNILAKLLVIGLMIAIFPPSGRGMADDTCIFNLSDDVEPNVVLFLDNGAQMEYVVTHSDYDSTVDHTPFVWIKNEGVNGFFNENGYGIYVTGGQYFIQGIDDDLSLDSSLLNRVANGDGKNPVWTINGRTIALPGKPSASVDANGIKDNATRFRFTKDYLNWLFFGSYAGNGSDLPRYSNFYQAKEAIFEVAKQTANEARFGIYYFTNTSGASQAQPLSFVVDTVANPVEDSTLDSSFINNVNNMGTVAYSPLAEGLADVGDYFGSNSSHVVGEYCQKNFVIVVSAGVSSMDRYPGFTWMDASDQLADHDYDGDDDNGGIGEGNIKVDSTVMTIPTNLYGTTMLDDIALALYENDVVDYQTGFQNVMTYTVGFAGTAATRAFMINTSNNGNGNTNLYDSTDAEYGLYHFQAEAAADLPVQLKAAMASILETTSTFTAPVVPVTRTTSGDKIYLSFFTPVDGSNFWEGNVTKFGLSPTAYVTAVNEIVDKNGYLATYSNGAMRAEAEPYWQTRSWADPTAGNYMANGARNIYTYFGTADLTATDNEFSTANGNLTDDVLDNPVSGAAYIINYFRGADVDDEDNDGNTTENRDLITGDALHSEPAVYEFTYQRGNNDPDIAHAFTRVFYGGNDGMVHAVDDEDGTEVWGFIPHDQLPRLKFIVENVSHVDYIDSSMKIYFNDLDGDGYIDDADGDGSYDAGSDDQVIMVFGERQGGEYYHALDITYPDSPRFLWSIDSSSYPYLGNTWSEPVFGKVKTSDSDTTGTDVMFVGGGYSYDNSTGNAIYAINVQDGSLVKEFRNSTGVTSGSMDYCIPSNLTVVDIDGNGFIDKAYVGDVGGQMWRIGKFTDSGGTPLTFPATNENINDWEAQVLFKAGCDEASCTDNADNDGDGIADEYRPFFYAPEVALEYGYDLILTGTGDRTDPCNGESQDRIFVVRDDHQDTDLTASDFVDASTYSPNLDASSADVDGNFAEDLGFYYPLVTGEKVLAEGLLFYKVFYITTFYPSGEPCVAGGNSYVYSIQYKTGQAGTDLDGDGNKDLKTEIGGGIASKPVVIIRENTQNLLISVGSTSASDDSDSTGAGAVNLDPAAPDFNWFYIWWKGLTD